MKDWVAIAMRRDVAIRALKVGVIVGTLLTVINQGDAILAGNLPAAVFGKILLTYVVPYCVSTYAAVEAIRAQSDR